MAARDCTISHKQFDWDISFLQPFLAARFFDLVVKEGNELVRGLALSTCRYYIDALKSFGAFLEKPPNNPVPNDLKKGISPQHSRRDWNRFLDSFSRYLKDTNTPGQARKRSLCFNEWLVRLASRGICPAKLKMPIIEKPRPKSPQTVLHALTKEQFQEVEALYSSEAFSGDSDLVEEAKLVCSNVLSEFNAADLSVKNLSELIEAALDKRLSNLYKGLWEVFEGAVQKRSEGARLIKEGAEFAPIIDTWLLFPSSFKVKKNKPIVERVRNLSDEQFWAGLLAWFMDYHALRGLHAVEGHADKSVVARLRNEIRDHRPNLKGVKYCSDELIALMGASRDLIVSGFLLMIFETWANPGSLANITIHSKTDVLENLSVIDWTKTRAKKILSHWDSSADSQKSVRRIFNEVISATNHYRRYAHASEKDALFLHIYAHGSSAKDRKWAKDYIAVKCQYQGFFADNSSNLIKRLSNGHWEVKPRALRTSLILLDAMKSGVSSAQHKAQHSESRVTTGYVSSFPFKLKLEEHMREYIEWLEALVTIKLEDVANKLGLDEEEFERIREDVLTSQFGSVHCSDPKSGFQPGSVPGVPCNQIMMCMSCEKRRNIFIASENNVANLLKWRDALLEAFEAGVVEDSNANWVLWRVYVETMYQRLKGSLKHKALLVDVESRLAEQTENEYRNVFFRSGECA